MSESCLTDIPRLEFKGELLTERAGTHLGHQLLLRLPGQLGKTLPETFKRGCEYSSVAENLPSTCKAMGPIPNENLVKD